MNNSPSAEKQALTVSVSPHMHAPYTTKTIMLDVILAMCPLLIFAVWHFGWRSLALTAISVASCLLFEYLFTLITKSHLSIGDLSACVTGILLVLTLPSSAPLWMPVIGAFFGIIIVKQLFGGIGKNFAKKD